MRRILAIAGMLGGSVFGAAAQEGGQQVALDKLKAELDNIVRFNVEGGVMGQPVLGAPYSATEVTERTQTLADGTKIHNENQTQVYRDGEGRTRREVGNAIVIMDPVARMRYSINTENKTAMAMPVKFVAGSGGKVAMGMIVTGSQSYQVTDRVVVNGQEMSARTIKKDARDIKSEDLGQQPMEGVVAQGARTTRTINAGEIGNDRPISIVSERWYSPQLQTVVMTRQDDPRSGENVFRLTNVKLGEPDPSLFQVPAGYQIVERK